jgi:hypothetical protein
MAGSAYRNIVLARQELGRSHPSAE